MSYDFPLSFSFLVTVDIFELEGFMIGSLTSVKLDSGKYSDKFIADSVDLTVEFQLINLPLFILPE